MKVSDPVR
jgi:hypothetical protein